MGEERCMQQGSVSGGIGITGLTGLLFIALKLMGYVAWPWVWVLSPFWIPTVLFTILIGIILIWAAAVEFRSHRE